MSEVLLPVKESEKIKTAAKKFNLPPLSGEGSRETACEIHPQNGRATFRPDNKRSSALDWLDKTGQEDSLKHTQLSIRLLENAFAARVSAFNAHNVGKFYDLLEDIYTKHIHRIYNCDETGMSTVPNKPSCIISLKGKKQVGALSSQEIETLVTAEICFNAVGNFILPTLIFSKVRHNYLKLVFLQETRSSATLLVDAIRLICRAVREFQAD
ncbi:hypothetical protein ILUMI_24038 [Ignelater luminosus]|uniref:Uncharacterized protein n=1 Tax=Ignelater luminosus TaxID=2038154 RepID=A0A8K0CB90_IGNLU|nr:hypothetical protein ILUMI_24038 [Ignelater luminosus]